MLNGTLRSVTGVAAKLGDNNNNTYTGWTYDSKDGAVRVKVSFVGYQTQTFVLKVHLEYKDV